MSKGTKRILLIIIMSVLALAAALLIYGLMPLQDLKEIIPITPTFLMPPGAVP